MSEKTQIYEKLAKADRAVPFFRQNWQCMVDTHPLALISCGDGVDAPKTELHET